MTPWPTAVINRFAQIPPNPKEKDFNGPYNKLLTTLFFPPDSEYTVSPQAHPVFDTSESINFVVEYEVCHGEMPIFLLEIKDPSGIQYKFTRVQADDQVRRRLNDLSDHSALPKLYAVSAFGTRLCFYYLDANQSNTKAIVPRFIKRGEEYTTDAAPLDRWDCDVLEPEGAQRLKDVVAQIKQWCEDL